MSCHPSSVWNQCKNFIKHKKEQGGGVLFLILIAVALFAALSYVVSQSTRSGGGDASREQNTLDASQITQYGTEIQTAIMRMKISNSCTDEQISFENSIVSGYTNPNAPSDFRCHVFRAEGGNVTFKKPPPNSLDSSKSSFPNYGDYVYTVNYVSYLGTDSNPTGREQMVMLPYLKKDLCIAINDRLSIGTKGEDPKAANTYMGSSLNWNGKWQGTYIISGVAYIDDVVFRTRHSGCTMAAQELNTSTNVGTSYLFFHALIVR